MRLFLFDFELIHVDGFWRRIRNLCRVVISLMMVSPDWTANKFGLSMLLFSLLLLFLLAFLLWSLLLSLVRSPERRCQVMMIGQAPFVPGVCPGREKWVRIESVVSFFKNAFSVKINFLQVSVFFHKVIRTIYQG